MLDSTYKRTMTTFSRRIQQASWRTRRQTIGTILLVIVGVVMVAALYLDVAARTTLIGREIQSLEWETGQIESQNANFKTELARLLSHHEVAVRSDELGFRRATAAETHYLVVPGYMGKETVNLVIPDETQFQSYILTEAYSQSLFNWIGDQIFGGLVP